MGSVEDLVIANIEILPNDEQIISIGQVVQLKVLATNSAGMQVPEGTIDWSTSNSDVLDVSNAGLMSGSSIGEAVITATAGNKSATISFHVVDLTGTWIGGEFPDTVSYMLIQIDTIVTGLFQSRLGFPPITDVNEGNLSGYLIFDRYFHNLDLVTEDGCNLRISGAHRVEIQMDGELVLIPGSGTLSSSNCPISGTIDFATLRRQ